MLGKGAPPVSEPSIESLLEGLWLTGVFIDEPKKKIKKCTSPKSGVGAVVASGSRKGRAWWNLFILLVAILDFLYLTETVDHEPLNIKCIVI
jgi:hypothetical protein